MENLTKILFIVSSSNLEDSKSLGRLISTTASQLRNQVEVILIHTDLGMLNSSTNNIKTSRFRGFAQLASFLQKNLYDVIHFCGTKSTTHLIYNNASKRTKLVKTIFSIDEYMPEYATKMTQVLNNLSPSNLCPNYFIGYDSVNEMPNQMPNKTSILFRVSKFLDSTTLNRILQLATEITRRQLPYTLLILGASDTSLIPAQKLRHLGIQDIISFIDVSQLNFQELKCYVDIDSTIFTQEMFDASTHGIPIITNNDSHFDAVLSLGKLGVKYNKNQDNLCSLIHSISPPSEQSIQKLKQTLQTSEASKYYQALYRSRSSSSILSVQQETLFIIIPYPIFGGGEIYLKNHIEKGIITNAHLVFLSEANALYPLMKDSVSATIIGDLNNLAPFLKAQKAKRVLFYNSGTIAKLLRKIKPILDLSIYEVIHSRLEWGDSMHGVDRSFVDEIFVVANTVAKQWNLSNYHVLPPTINEARFQIAKVKQPKFTIGTVARISFEKNLKKVVDIAACLNDSFQFIIVGKDGGQKKQLEEYINLRKMNKRVMIKDHRDDIEKDYATFDCFLLTSHIEGTPLTILEAQASNIPVVAPNVGAIEEMLRRGVDRLYDPSESASNIAKHLLALANKEGRFRNSQGTLVSSLITPKSSRDELDLLETDNKAEKAQLNILYVQKNTCIRAIKQGVALKAAGHTVHLYCVRSPSKTYQVDEDQIFETITRMPLVLFKDKEFMQGLHKLIELHDIDVIHCHNEPDSPTILACNNKYKIPVIHDTHDSVSMILEDNKRISPAVVRKYAELEKRANQASSGRLYVSEQQRDYIIKRHKTSSENNLIVPNCFIGAWKAREFKPKLSSQDGKIHVVYVGGVVLDRSHSYYIYDIVDSLVKQGIHVHIYPSVVNNEIKDIYQSLSSLVHFHDTIPPQDIAYEISQYDFGSCFFNELIPTSEVLACGIPNKYFDYCSAKLPTLTTARTAALAQLIKTTNSGIITTPELVRQDTTNVPNMISDTAFSAIYKQYSYEAYVERIIQLYRKTLRTTYVI